MTSTPSIVPTGDASWMAHAAEQLLESGVSILPALHAERPDLAARLDELAADLLAARGATAHARTGLRDAGAFEIVETLGHGSMGRVLLVLDCAVANRPVALKMLHAHLRASDEARGRLQREIEALAGLSHPHVLPVLSVQRGDDGEVVGYTMPLIRGCSLAEVLAGVFRSGHPDEPHVDRAQRVVSDAAARLDALLRESSSCVIAPPADPAPGIFAAPNWSAFVCRIGLSVAHALGAAHAAGLVHRDVKPSNVLIDTAGRVWLADFGLVALTNHDAQPTLTATHGFVGTEAYAAPEQRAAVDGARGVGPPADVYALGRLLQHALTGQRPDRSDAPGTARPRSTARGGMARDVRLVLDAATDPSPALRYADGAAFADDLQRVLAFEPVRARPTPWTRRAVRALRRRHGAMRAFALGNAAAVAIAVVALWFLVIAPQQGRSIENDALRILVDEAAGDVYQSIAFWIPATEDEFGRSADGSIRRSALKHALATAVGDLEPALRWGRGTAERRDLSVTLRAAHALIMDVPFDVAAREASYAERYPGAAAFIASVADERRHELHFPFPIIDDAERWTVLQRVSGTKDAELTALLAFLTLDHETARVIWSRVGQERDGAAVGWALRAIHAHLEDDPAEQIRWAEAARDAGFDTSFLSALHLEGIIDSIIDAELRRPETRDLSRRAWAERVLTSAAFSDASTNERVRLLADLLHPERRPAVLERYREIGHWEPNPLLVADAVVALEALGHPGDAIRVLAATTAESGRLWHVWLLHAMATDLMERVEARFGSTAAGERAIGVELGTFGAMRHELAILQLKRRPAEDMCIVDPPMLPRRLSRLTRRRAWLERQLAPSGRE